MFPTLRGYKRAWASADLVAGLTNFAVVVPQALAYATLAGLPVQAGLYCAIVPAVLYALLGGSRRLSISTTSTVSALTASTLAAVGATTPDRALGAAGTLAVMVGLILLCASVLRLGFLVDHVSDAVMTGFKIGMGLTIAIGQLGALLGLGLAGSSGVEKLGSAIGQLGSTQGPTALLGFGTVLILLLLKRFVPRVPGPLVALVVGIVLVWLAGIDAHGVALISPVPTGLPPVTLPVLSEVGALVPGALAITLMGFLESISAARATQQPGDPDLDNDREMAALGLASVGSGLFGGYPTAGGLSQSAVNAAAGARTQSSALVSVVLAIATALFFAPVLSMLPAASLGAVVFVSALGLVKLKSLRQIWAVRHDEFWIALIAGVVALCVGLLAAVVAGVALSIISLLANLDRAPFIELGRDGAGEFRALPAAVEGDRGFRHRARRVVSGGVDAVAGGEGVAAGGAAGGEAITSAEMPQRILGLLIVRFEAPLYTGNARRAQERLFALLDARSDSVRVVVMDARRIDDLSFTATDVFVDTRTRLNDRGIVLWAAGMDDQARERIMAMNSTLPDPARRMQPGPTADYPDLGAAVWAAGEYLS